MVIVRSVIVRDVIVGVDRSEHAHRTATTAAELAAALRANLHVVTCIDRTRLDSLHEVNQFLVELS
ncbi:MAG: universal stress protein, partial [Ilumatobacteraceae bacterium]